MARKGFEVKRVIFNCNEQKNQEEAKLILQVFQKLLKKYASNTKIFDQFILVYNGNAVIHIEFQKKISVNTVNNILSKMLLDKYKMLNIIYDGVDNEMKVIILK